MDLSEYYSWELETVDGQIYSHEKGDKWQDADPDQVIRASLIPNVVGLPRHDIFCYSDNKFKKWFGKGYIKQEFKFKLGEYANCIETEKFRFWVLSTTGHTITTHTDFILRI